MILHFTHIYDHNILVYYQNYNLNLKQISPGLAHNHTLHPSSYILPDASRQSGQKTRVVKRSISPTYNHTMVYDGFHTSDLREACAELTVWQREGLKMHVLGGVRLSCGTGETSTF